MNTYMKMLQRTVGLVPVRLRLVVQARTVKRLHALAAGSTAPRVRAGWCYDWKPSVYQRCHCFSGRKTV